MPDIYIPIGYTVLTLADFEVGDSIYLMTGCYIVTKKEQEGEWIRLTYQFTATGEWSLLNKPEVEYVGKKQVKEERSPLKEVQPGST